MLKDAILKFLKLDSFIESLTGYLETRVELLKVEVKEDIVKLLVKVLLLFIIVFFFFFFLLFISAALAFWLSLKTDIVNSFAIVAGIYLLATLVLVLFKEPLGKNLRKKLLADFKLTKK